MERDNRSRLIEQYGAGPAVLQAAWNACPPGARDWKPSGNAWSAHEIIIHCCDSETFAATRIRLLLAEPTPVIVGYDQDAWVHTFTYHEVPVYLAFATITAVRASTLHVIRSLDDKAWQVVGRHTESGPYSAQDWLNIYGVHLHDHADQINTNADQWRMNGDKPDLAPSERNTQTCEHS